jgi:NADH:ubiquinone oxidoreductase subunit 3 (subunit A)
MSVATLLFILFALFSAIGVFLIVAHHRSRAAGTLGALATLLFFVAIYAGVLYLLSPLDQPPP